MFGLFSGTTTVNTNRTVIEYTHVIVQSIQFIAALN